MHRTLFSLVIGMVSALVPFAGTATAVESSDAQPSTLPTRFSNEVYPGQDLNGFQQSASFGLPSSPTEFGGELPSADFLAPVAADSTSDGEFTPERWKALLRPSFAFDAEWQARTDGVELSSSRAGIKFPTFPLFGPPPPFINAGFRYTNVDAPISFGLPTDLYETELGFAWMRKFNDRWMARLMAGASFATDGHNSSSDAWRFRGGIFALYRRNPKWTWTFGAIALGRNDLPVLPAVGVIYQPNPGLRFDLIMPKPRVSFLLVDNGPRQQWGYIGAGLSGTTWGVERTDGVNDQLTYGDFRLTLGWESTPTPEPGMPFTRGRKMGAEIGYVFSRDFEFESDESKIRLDDTWMLRGTVSF